MIKLCLFPKNFLKINVQMSKILNILQLTLLVIILHHFMEYLLYLIYPSCMPQLQFNKNLIHKMLTSKLYLKMFINVLTQFILQHFSEVLTTLVNNIYSNSYVHIEVFRFRGIYVSNSFKTCVFAH